MTISACSRNFSALAASLLLGTTGFAQTPFINTLMPQPVALQPATGDLAITPQLKITLKGANDPLLRQAAQRMVTKLEQHTALPLTTALVDDSHASIQIDVVDHSQQRPMDGVDESYTLNIQNGTATLHAQTDFGAMHGMETLLQLIQGEGSSYVIPAVHIEDSPRFPWRGLLLDPGRHFLPIDNVLRTLDAMAAVKMNVLHWHLTEDQGFRIESKRFPKLHELGSGGQYYTQDQVRAIVRYATDRGIRVVPEFDIPGHSSTWMIGYPELASAPGPYRVEEDNRIYDAAMDPTRESTYRFLDSFLEEMTSLFPDEYIHIGGDESNGKHWRSNPEIERFMQQHNMKSTNELQTYFNSRVQKLLTRHHRRMVGWDEILQPDLSSEVVVQNWHGIEFLIDGARRGHKGILSKPFYLDHHYSAEEMYAVDPVPSGNGLTPAQKKLILGGEACMWGEQVDFRTVDSRIWPRTAAVAERLWSPASVHDTQDMYRRLAVISLRLDDLGVTHLSNPTRGMRQISGGDTDALQIFASVVQPVDFHERYKEQHTSATTPMTNIIDFTVFDPLSRNHFRELVAAYLQSSAREDIARHTKDRAELENTFHHWLSAAQQLSMQSQANPKLANIAQRRLQWMQLASLGLQAMALIEAKQPADPAWFNAQQSLLKASADPTELVDFVALGPLNELLKATSQPATGL